MGIVLKKNSDNLSLGAQAVRAVEEVYVGDSAPTEDKGYKIWVNPDEDDVAEIAELATKKYVDDAIANVEVGGGGSVDLTGYATEEYVDEKFNSIKIPEVDLTGYALKSEIPDTSAFQTEDEVKSLINLALGEVENGTY